MADEIIQEPVETTEPETAGPDGPETGPKDAKPTLEDALKQLQDAKSHVKKLNAESAERRKRLETFEKAEKERADAQLSETERLTKQHREATEQLTAAQSALKDERTRNAIELAAYALDFHDPEDAIRLVDYSAVALDDAGRPDKSSVREALEALAKAKPHLVDRKAAAGPGTPSGRTRSPHTTRAIPTDRPTEAEAPQLRNYRI